MDESFVHVDPNTPPANRIDGPVTPPRPSSENENRSIGPPSVVRTLPTIADGGNNGNNNNDSPSPPPSSRQQPQPPDQPDSPPGLIYAPSPPRVMDEYLHAPSVDAKTAKTMRFVVVDGHLHPPPMPKTPSMPQTPSVPHTPSVSVCHSPSMPMPKAPPPTPGYGITAMATPVSAIPPSTPAMMRMMSPSARPPRPFGRPSVSVRERKARYDRGGPCCCPFGFDCPDPPACPTFCPSECRGAPMPPPETPAIQPSSAVVVPDSSILQAPSRPASKIDQKTPVSRLGMNINWICCYERPCDALSFCHSASDWPLLKLQASEQSSVCCLAGTPLRFLFCGCPAGIIGGCFDIGRVICFLDGSIFGPAAERSCAAFRSAYCGCCCICEFPSVRRRIVQDGSPICCWMATKPKPATNNNDDNIGRGPFDAYPVRSLGDCCQALFCVGFGSAPVGVPINRLAKLCRSDIPAPADGLPPAAASMRR